MTTSRAGAEKPKGRSTWNVTQRIHPIAESAKANVKQDGIGYGGTSGDRPERRTGSVGRESSGIYTVNPLLEEPQITLLSDLVEASKRVPSQQRQDFLAYRLMGADPRVPVKHPGLPDDYWTHPQDIELLRRAGLVAMSKADNNIMLFFVMPEGVKYYEESKRKAGSPVERVEAEVRRWIGADHFRRTHPEAYAKWATAEELLWSTDSLTHLSAIGHHCREAMQDFATALVERYRPAAVSTNYANTVARLTAVLNAARLESLTERAFLDALVSYWGTVSDLAQRQEHGGQREARAVTWEDARRVVFQVMVVMHEVARSLDGHGSGT